jgi:hypothetical protein
MLMARDMAKNLAERVRAEIFVAEKRVFVKEFLGQALR